MNTEFDLGNKITLKDKNGDVKEYTVTCPLYKDGKPYAAIVKTFNGYREIYYDNKLKSIDFEEISNWDVINLLIKSNLDGRN